MAAMADPIPRAGAAAPDALDSMLDYDQAVDDFLRDIPLNNDPNTTTANNASHLANDDPDAEIKVRKQRKPVAKLDEARLLSDAGVPKLRRIVKTKLKFEGKGHEFSDIGRLLNLYQLWLDDLYPRAKFRDGLQMVEKVGHSKRMQITRKAWMDGTKGRRREESVERIGDVDMSGALSEGQQQGDAEQNHDNGDDDVFGEELREQQQAQAARQNNDDTPEDDELDALMMEHAPTARQDPAQQQKQKGPFEEDDAEPDEDDLDALLAEDSVTSHHALAKPRGSASENQPEAGDGDEFADEEEAMASMGGVW